MARDFCDGVFLPRAPGCDVVRRCGAGRHRGACRGVCAVARASVETSAQGRAFIEIQRAGRRRKSVRGQRVQESVHGGASAESHDAAADQTDRDRIHDGAVAPRNHLVQTHRNFHAARAISMNARLAPMSRATLARRRKRRGKLRDACQRRHRRNDVAARCAWARKTPSQNPEPSVSIAASQSRNDAASPISPASTPTRSRWNRKNAPTGNDGDSHVINRYSARRLAFTHAAGIADRRRLTWVMSMGMAVMMIMVAMLVMRDDGRHGDDHHDDGRHDRATEPSCADVLVRTALGRMGVAAAGIGAAFGVRTAPRSRSRARRAPSPSPR